MSYSHFRLFYCVQNFNIVSFFLLTQITFTPLYISRTDITVGLNLFVSVDGTMSKPFAGDVIKNNKEETHCSDASCLFAFYVNTKF